MDANGEFVYLIFEDFLQNIQVTPEDKYLACPTPP
jgi:hypothetical protein